MERRVWKVGGTIERKSIRAPKQRFAPEWVKMSNAPLKTSDSGSSLMSCLGVDVVDSVREREDVLDARFSAIFSPSIRQYTQFFLIRSNAKENKIKGG